MHNPSAFDQQKRLYSCIIYPTLSYHFLWREIAAEVVVAEKGRCEAKECHPRKEWIRRNEPDHVTSSVRASSVILHRLRLHPPSLPHY